MKKLHKGDRVKVVKNVIKIKPCLYQCKTRAGRLFNVDGYMYLRNSQCEICGCEWYSYMNIYDGKSFYIKRALKHGAYEDSNYNYVLCDPSDEVIKDEDGEAIFFCSHWLKPIKTVISTSTHRINYVMMGEIEQEQVQEPKQVQNGIEY